MGQIKSFEDLISWQEALQLAVIIYRLTKTFPNSEQFALTNQLRRASSSISANIAEGFGRQSQKEKLQFYTIAYGSLLEVKSFLYLCEKLEYCDNKHLTPIFESIVILQKRINSLLRAIRKH